MGIARLMFLVALALALAACASRPINVPITQVDPQSGYRPYLLIPKRQNNDQSTLMILSFSGGGTRAAAFSYGILEELRRTEVVVQGMRRRLLDEVDIVTGVSGGSFTALAYALYGERLFSEYESRFLKRDVEGALIGRLINPLNWWRFIGSSAGRSELAAEYYDEILFEGATFADLLDKQGPVALATGTDLSTGSRLIFFQNDFDLLCSDLNKVRLSRAAATSSAVPVVLSPVTFNNYGGTCNFQYPLWVKDVANPETRARPSGRAYQRYREMQNFQNSKERPYIHLVDGGVADNIGVRAALEFLEELEASSAYAEQVGFGDIRRIVLMVVDSHSAPASNWDKKETPPGFITQMLQSTNVPIEKYSFETVEIMKDMAEVMLWKRQLKVAHARLAGLSESKAEASVPTLALEVIAVSFDEIRDPEERTYYMELPTSFVLSSEEIDRLRNVAGEILRESKDFEALIRGFDASPKKWLTVRQ
ncbi:patatin-like phospholipase family protein [Candidimonas sp. SYP-B2681]|uniref:patatin-like phospholipase family protein n=1 Tax=Candidimonas sp. SYP-B2681 TaxID=2497686 RepID=UPI0013152886|nr:patatin-like phospholipase family protein [Candidimonas sp. SYP-B2681]